ncbi:ABC transporter substrate-binding protein [Neobacillus novalis]|uniref:ABC transporter substrate-binding protein n=1 Tax=Neobacillus novalis TaxID=220687 RepID=A0AA95SAJ9_9BACI|nr:ABC transporter substrate-binding protein [Neobacillus novalis]WHY83998.1 ABC transporter substrate-binding protein [Neobacillus novalis]
MFNGFKKIVTTTAVTLLGIALISGCAGKETSQKTASGDTSAKGSIKVGVIGSFSGAGADMGITMRNGVEMAIKKFNDDGGIDGRKIEIINYDDEGNPTKATSGAQKLISSEKVVAILGNPNTATSIATANVSRSSKVPQIVPIAQSPEVLQPASPWIFRVSAVSTMDIDSIVAFIKEKGWKNIGLLYDTSAYGMSGKQIFDKVIPEEGLKIVASEGYTVGAPDLTTQALNLKKANVDVVIVWGLGADHGRFVSNLEKIGWNIPNIGGRGSIFKIFTNIGGKAANGTIATASLDLGQDEVKTWVDQYHKDYGNEGTIDFAALGYDAAKVLIEAIRKADAKGEINRQRIRDAIESIDKFDTLTGPKGYSISFGPDKHEGSSNEAVIMVEHKDGEWVPVQ